MEYPASRVRPSLNAAGINDGTLKQMVASKGLQQLENIARPNN